MSGEAPRTHSLDQLPGDEDDEHVYAHEDNNTEIEEETEGSQNEESSEFDRHPNAKVASLQEEFHSRQFSRTPPQEGSSMSEPAPRTAALAAEEEINEYGTNAEDSSWTADRFARLFGVSWNQSQPHTVVSTVGADQALSEGDSSGHGRYSSFDASESSTTTMFSAASSQGEHSRTEKYGVVRSKDDNDRQSVTRLHSKEPDELFHSDGVTREHQAYKRRTWKNSGFFSQIGSMTSFSIFSRGRKTTERRVDSQASSPLEEVDSAASTGGSNTDGEDQSTLEGKKDIASNDDISPPPSPQELGLPGEVSSAVEAMEKIQELVRGTDFKKAIRHLHRRCLEKEEECSHLYEQCYQLRDERKTTRKQLESLRKKTKEQEKTINRLKETLREVRSNQFGAKTMSDVLQNLSEMRQGIELKNAEASVTDTAEESNGKSRRLSESDASQKYESENVLPHEKRIEMLEKVYNAADGLRNHAKYLLETDKLHETSKVSQATEKSAQEEEQTAEFQVSSRRSSHIRFLPKILGDPTRTRGRGIRVLSMDGGGVRYVLSLVVRAGLAYNDTRMIVIQRPLDTRVSKATRTQYGEASK
eukprot:gb/GECG01005031.1/.p1 GENE.gb/GECG01005031.1/~~gb/GECG01005031.1/.p1  ORF type:complete len:588 (+),score=106.19 gb/GECG01005031.1/:1-1764(+)